MHLVDPLPLHVEQARQAAGSGPAAAFTAAVGDARELAEPGRSQDAVVLFGPLYHLTDAADRRQALGEARRVLRPGGRLLAKAVCRFASLPDELYEGWLDDPHFPDVQRDLVDGQHRNPDPVGRPEFFTTAYFHTPDGLAGEIDQAGFADTAVYGVEGPGWPLRREVGRSRTGLQRGCEGQRGGATPQQRRAVLAVTWPTCRRGTAALRDGHGREFAHSLLELAGT